MDPSFFVAEWELLYLTFALSPLLSHDLIWPLLQQQQLLQLLFLLEYVWMLYLFLCKISANIINSAASDKCFLISYVLYISWKYCGLIIHQL